jgi:hypothetical protein
MFQVLFSFLFLNQFINLINSQIHIISLENGNKKLINYSSLLNKLNENQISKWQLIHSGSENIYFIKLMNNNNKLNQMLQSNHAGSIFISKLNLNSWYQKWRLIKSKHNNNDSIYYLRNMATGRQLDNNQGSYLNTQPPNENNNSQKWLLQIS